MANHTAIDQARLPNEPPIHDSNVYPVLSVLEEQSGRKPVLHDSEPSSQSAFEQFLDSFFQEKNIRWMLVVGAVIVFGSSLMLVTREWSHWTTTAQFLTIIAYTSAIFGFAQLSRHRLGLLTTAKVLDVLTLLLLPVSFLSLSWLTSRSSATSGLQSLHAIPLLVPAAILTWFASQRIFDDWLRGRQTTFLVSYVVLCLSGAFPVITAPRLAASVSLFLWLVMTAGIVKVDRHVFWMVEEYRSPRVFGFLPIGPLGLLFTLLMASKTLRAIPFEWNGLVCTAVATTVLLTGRSIANVYRQRTGDLVRPLPWNIVLPRFVGVVLTSAGVCISFYKFSYFGPTTLAVVPTALVSAVLMWMLAKETKHSGFAWVGLVFLAIGYQTMPTLTTELIQQVKATAARALAEEKLPLAFYGLTYLPLLLALGTASHYYSARRHRYLSKPLQQFATIIAFVLFATSFTHAKAIFPVASANAILFTAFACMFRERWYMIVSLFALILSVGAWIPFGNSVGWFDVSWFYAVTSLGCLASLLVSTRFPDRWIRLIPEGSPEDQPLTQHQVATPATFCQTAGLSLVLSLALFAVGLIVDRFGNTWSRPQAIAFGMILLSSLLSAVRVEHYLTGFGFWSLTLISGASWILGLEFDGLDLITIATVASTATSLLISTYVLLVYPGQSYRAVLSRMRTELGIDAKSCTIKAAIPETATTWLPLVRVFAVPLGDICFAAIMALTAFYHIPMLFVSNATNDGMLTPFATTLSLVWLLVYGMLFKNPVASVAAFAMLPLWTTALVISLSPALLSASTLPLIWSAVAGILLFAFERTPGNEQRFAKLVGQGWLAGVFAMSFLYSDLPLRCAGLLSLGLLTISIRDRLDNLSRTWIAILGNIQVLMFVALLSGVRGWLPSQTTDFFDARTVTYFLPIIASSILIFDHRWVWLDSIASRNWAFLLRAAFVVGVYSLLGEHLPDRFDTLLVSVSILGLAFAGFLEAARYQKEPRVWTGICSIAFGGFFLAYHGVIAIGAGTSQFVMLATSILSLFMVHRVKSSVPFAIFVRPLRTVGLCLPSVVVVTAVVRILLSSSTTWTGWNSLALLIAACIYFQMGLLTKQNRYYLASGAILNITLALLWHMMKLYDFQLYLVPLGLSIIGVVELLRKELPKESHDPIRYLGALTILVSPLFEILNGSWWHLFSLMVLSVCVILLSIGLRLRVLVYTGSAFLMADMVAMVVRTTIDHPGLLWVGGLALGVAVIALAAICERHRERLLERIRLLSNELAAWH